MAPWLFLLAIIFFFLLLYLTAAYLEKKGLLYRDPRKSSATSAGAALLELNAIAQPKTSHTIKAVQMRPLVREEDGEGDGGKYVVRLLTL